MYVCLRGCVCVGVCDLMLGRVPNRISDRTSFGWAQFWHVGGVGFRLQRHARRFDTVAELVALVLLFPALPSAIFSVLFHSFFFVGEGGRLFYLLLVAVAIAISFVTTASSSSSSSSSFSFSSSDLIPFLYTEYFRWLVGTEKEIEGEVTLPWEEG